MEVNPSDSSIEVPGVEVVKEKLRVQLLKKTLEVEQENGETLLQMITHLGQNLDIRV